MGKRFPHVRLLGDEALAATLVRRAKQELLRTIGLAKQAKVPVFSRRVPLSAFEYIETSVVNGLELITIFAVAPSEEVPAKQLVTTVEIPEIPGCPPAFLVYRRGYLEGYPFYSGGLYGASVWDLPFDEDPDNPGVFDVDRRDSVGKVLAYNNNSDSWQLATIETTIEAPSGFLGAFAKAEKSSESFHGGWWGLSTIIEDLNGDYPKCDLLTWAGCSTSFMTFNGMFESPPTDNEGIASPWDVADSPPTPGISDVMVGLRPYLWFAGTKVVVNSVGLAERPRVVLGASILADEGVDYFYVYLSGEDTFFGAIYEELVPTGQEYIYRAPVDTMLDPNVSIDYEWEQVAVIDYTDYGVFAPSGSSISGSTFYDSIFQNCGFVALNGESITLTRDINYDSGVGICRLLVEISMLTGNITLLEMDYTDTNPVGTVSESFTFTSDTWAVCSQSGSASIQTGGKGRLLYLFSGLDKLYLYREEINGSSSLNIGESTEGLYSSSLSCGFTIDVVCYEVEEGEETEISRLRVHDMSAAPSYNIAIGNVGSGSGTGGMHKKHVTFHHPKIPANWHFTQYDGAHDYSGSVAAQMATYKGPGTKDLEDSGAIDISDAALAQIDSEGYIQSNFIFFDRADQSIYHTTATSRPGPRPGTNAKADPAYDALNPADYSVSLNFGLRWGRVRHLPGSTYTFRYTNLIDLAAIVGTSSVWDYFAPCSSHFFDYAEKRNRNLAHRWIENTSFAGVRTLYYPNNAVVHRPIPGTSKWSYIYYLPKYYTVNGISNSLVQGIMNSRTAQEPYSSNHYLFYTKVQGWVIPPGDSDDPPEGVGFNDVNFFSNVLTLEQIKSIVGEDENFLDGLGVT